MNSSEIYVIKRDGRKQEVHFEKVQRRIKNESINLTVNPNLIAQKICSRIFDGVTTSELDELTAQICTSYATEHPDYGVLAKRIIISNCHKNTPNTFVEAMDILFKNTDTLGKHSPLVSDDIMELCKNFGDKIEAQIDYERDYLFDYFGFKTLQKNYLLKSEGKIVERIQHLFMRVSLGLHSNDLENAFLSYHLLSQKYFTQATPTLYHSGTPNPQCLSCFLLGTEDSVTGMYKTISDCAKISKWAGGIGVHVSNIRSRGAYIRGSNGESSGLIPMLRVYNATARHIDQAGKRKGSIAIYLEPYHPDIMDFLDLRKNNGNEEARARDLFLALMVPDLFMRKVEYALKNPEKVVDWCLFDPDHCPDLVDVYGEEFERLYEKYEREGRYKEKMDITKLWKKILGSQIETGTPYIIYKDRVNEHSNQKNVGVIKSSNLCAEILEYSDSREYACCCLGSISLSEMVSVGNFREPVKVYTKSRCIYCDRAKDLLDNMGVKYEAILLDDNEERLDFYEEHSVTTMPQIFVGEKRIGGYQELVKYVKAEFDFDKLERVCNILVKNLNRVIDVNYYPVEETERSNFRHRPLGIGVQGLWDMFVKMRIAFDSEEARTLNKKIFESMQYYCLKASCEIAKIRDELISSNHFQLYVNEIVSKYQFEGSHHRMKINEIVDEDLIRYTYMNENFTLKEMLGFTGDYKLRKGTYSTFEGSPLSKGIFGFESMGLKVEDTFLGEKWNELRKDILKYGVRNSLLIALMPTASTSQILGNNECIEPITSNIYTRRTLAGDFVVVNKYLVEDLLKRGVWNKDIKDLIISQNGSVQNLPFLTKDEKELYKTVWEIKQKALIDLSADRTPFICQTQSLNLFFEEPKNNTLGSALLYGWKKGLKTGAYYIRSRPKVQAQQFTIDPKLMEKMENNYEVCESCSG